VNRKANTQNIRYLWLAGAADLIVIVVLLILTPRPSPASWIARGAALLGYTMISEAIVSSYFMRQMVRWFGYPFLKVHHALSIAGLALIAVHPIAAAVEWLSISIWIPRFDSLKLFFTWGGPPAFYLIAIATLAALLRKTIGKNWKLLHELDYMAFLLATVHGILLGTDLRYLVTRIVAIAMALAVTAVFVLKRFQERARAKARKS
jgi:sulfoxide reductase heme-binding subunit YedZ